MCASQQGIPAEWLRGVIVPILKGKRDIHGPERYRDVTLLRQDLTLDGRMRSGDLNRRDLAGM